MIAVDKTGTLTEGRIGLVDLVVTDAIDQDAALGLAASAEGDSEHLMARALTAAASTTGIPAQHAESFRVLKGRGVEAIVDGEKVLVGGPRLLEHLDVLPSTSLIPFAATAGEQGQSVVYLVIRGETVAAFALADVVRPESKPAIMELADMGIEVVMLTGDSHQVASTVASELGIEHFEAEVLPSDKDRLVAEMQSEGAMVGMVGDGVNDAPALTRADIGIAIGSGTDVAVQSADLVLVKSNPADIVNIVKLSAASYRKQVQNVWWGAGYNIVMVPLAAGVLAPWGFVMPPAVAALLMSLSTIVVAVNAQTLRRVDLS